MNTKAVCPKSLSPWDGMPFRTQCSKPYWPYFIRLWRAQWQSIRSSTWLKGNLIPDPGMITNVILASPDNRQVIAELICISYHFIMEQSTTGHHRLWHCGQAPLYSHAPVIRRHHINKLVLDFLLKKVFFSHTH